MALSPDLIQPAVRFDNTAFSNAIDDDGQVRSIYANYTCPRCRAGVVFTKTDFEDRVATRRSNLSEPIAAAMDRCAAENGLASRPFLDWECPGCGMAVRAYAQRWAGGRHGDHGLNLVAVLELQGERDSP